MRTAALTFAAVALAAVCPLAAETTTRPAGSTDSGRIDLLIKELGADDWRVRDAAQAKLRKLRDPAVVPALRRALKSPDLEVVTRAEQILAELLDCTHLVLDAVGDPIPGAKLAAPAAEPGAEEVVAHSTTLGGVSLRCRQGSARRRRVRFSHPQYGLAEGWAELFAAWVPGETKKVATPKEFRVPLVRKGTTAYERALRGVVLDAGGKPVAGAVITSSIVRTPGEGLIQCHDNLPQILTDARGRFAVYVPDRNARKERGRLIPPNSRYSVNIRPPEGAGLFPYAGEHHNTAEAKIRLQRPQRFHRLRFERSGGGFLETAAELGRIHVSYRRGPGSGGLGLDSRYVRDGGKLAYGTYQASDRHTRLEYRPIRVTKDSPETLVFRLPPSLTFRGRVVDGITGKGVAGAFVMGYASTSWNNLASLTEPEWQALAALGPRPRRDDPAVKPLHKMYGVHAIARTDAAGRYRLAQEPTRKFYGLIAFARHRLPFMHRTYKLQPDDQKVAAVPDLPLFPAAKVLVRPVFAGGRLSVSPKWLLERQGQPEWIKRFRAADSRRGQEAEFEYVHWLKLNQSQPIFVPAGLRLRLRFDTPYDDKWSRGACDKTILLAAGKQADIGEIIFAPCLPLKVLVVDADGDPVEGVPVRRMYKGIRHWSVAHNTDAKGLAHFHVEPASAGSFGVSKLLRKLPKAAPNRPIADFKVGEKTGPAEPCLITLTAEQIKMLFGS